MVKCVECNREITGFLGVVGASICADCRKGNRVVQNTSGGADDSSEPQGDLVRIYDQARANVILSTETTLPSPDVRRLGLVTGTCIFGQHLGRDLAASFTDLLGGRSKATEKVYADARAQALDELRVEADKLGANIVFALSIDHREISGGGKSMVMVTAVGTAAVEGSVQ